MRRRADWLLALGASLIALLLWSLREQLPTLERLDRSTLDLQLQVRGKLTPGQQTPLLLVSVDEQSLRQLGAAPSRAQIARLLQRLQAGGARAVALDLLLVEPQPEADAQLAATLDEARRTGLPVGLALALPAERLSGGSAPLPDALLTQAAARVFAPEERIARLPLLPQALLGPPPALLGAPLLGHVSAVRASDGALRYDLPLLPWQDEWFGSLALRLAGAAQGLNWAEAEARLGEEIRWGALQVPLDEASRLWVNYYGPAGQFPSLALTELLDESKPLPAELRGAVVLVGVTSLGSGDRYPSPFDAGLPGLERLATVTDNLLTGRALRAAPPSAVLVAMALLPLLAVLTLQRLRGRRALLALLGLTALLLVAAQWRLQAVHEFHALAFPLIALGIAVLGGALLRGQRERRRREGALQQLRRSEERYALAAEGAADGLWDWDLRDQQLYLSARWWQLMGRSPEPGAGMAAFSEGLGEGARAGFETALNEHLAGRSQQLHHVLQFRDGGQERALLVRGVAQRDAQGQPLRIAGSLTDLSETLGLQRQLAHDALHDRLTGLANRALFLEQLEQFPHPAPLAVALLGIDGFRALNEELGPNAGDAALRELARRLSQQAATHEALRPGVARLGPDLFGLAFVAPLEPGGLDAARTPELLLRCLDEPLTLPGSTRRLRATLGWAHRAHGLGGAEELLAGAEMALALAKAGPQRGSLRAYDPADQLLQNSRRWLREQIALALAGHAEGGVFELHYQPLIRLQDRRLLGFEALVRWQHPQRGFVMPGDFIPFAEESGQIVALGRWTLLEAARQLAAWSALGFDGEIAVNLSSRQFVEGDLQADVREALALLPEGVDPRRLKLEVTESMAMANPHDTATQLQALHALGVKLSIDDFGTGYSSLAYLHQFPFDTLKIDRSFVMRLHQGRDAQEIVRTIVGLTQALGKQALAEGVEEERQATLLQELGVQIGQGWLFGKAMPPLKAAGLFGGPVAALATGL